MFFLSTLSVFSKFSKINVWFRDEIGSSAHSSASCSKGVWFLESDCAHVVMTSVRGCRHAPDTLSHGVIIIRVLLIKHSGLIKVFFLPNLNYTPWLLALCCLLIALNEARWLRFWAALTAVVAGTPLFTDTEAEHCHSGVGRSGFFGGERILNPSRDHSVLTFKKLDDVQHRTPTITVTARERPCRTEFRSQGHTSLSTTADHTSLGHRRPHLNEQTATFLAQRFTYEQVPPAPGSSMFTPAMKIQLTEGDDVAKWIWKRRQNVGQFLL